MTYRYRMNLKYVLRAVKAWTLSGTYQEITSFNVHLTLGVRRRRRRLPQSDQ